jgi:hypothetical protein
MNSCFDQTGGFDDKFQSFGECNGEWVAEKTSQKRAMRVADHA